MNTEQIAYLDKLMLQPPADWPRSLQKTATEACKEVQASYSVIRAIAAAWILDGGDRFLSIPEIAALQPDVDLRPTMS